MNLKENKVLFLDTFGNKSLICCQMINIFTNPDLFRYINEYTELKTLCDTCILFATLKKYINYKLNSHYSLMYYDDILYKNMVLHKIFNPYKQLYLDFSYLNLKKVINVSVFGTLLRIS